MLLELDQMLDQPKASSYTYCYGIFGDFENYEELTVFKQEPETHYE